MQGTLSRGYAVDWRGIAHYAWFLPALVFAAIVVYEVALNWGWVQWALGNDQQMYLDRVRIWLGGGSFYLPRQLAGPYPIEFGDALYPPTMLLVLVPELFLPFITAWLIPLGLLGYAILKLRPEPMAWCFMLACLAWPPALAKVIEANPTLLFMGALALATVHRSAAPILLFKPTLAFFALFGIRSRGWWIGLAVCVLVSLPFLPLWFDYLRATLNSRNVLGVLYSFQDVPLLCIPLFAWAGRQRTAPEPYSPSAAMIRPRNATTWR